MAQSGRRDVDKGPVDDVSSLPMMMVSVKSEDDKNESRPWFYPAHLHQTQTEGNTEAEVLINNPTGQIKSEPDDDYCEGPELTSNPDSKTYLQESSDRKASGSSQEKPLSHLETKMESDDKDWNDSRSHGSGVNSDGESNTAITSLHSECGEETLHHTLFTKLDNSVKSLKTTPFERRTFQEQLEVKQLGPDQLDISIIQSSKDRSGVNSDGESNTAITSLHSECGEELHSQISNRVHVIKMCFSSSNSEKCLNTTQNINVQKSVDSGKKNVQCDICDKIFLKKSNLNVHMRLHTGDKPFSCDECGHKFTLKSGLNQHMSIHTGDKPFRCDECGHRFSRKEHLNRHMHIHTGDKPFKCDECEHTFRHKSTLSLHMRIHTSDKQFSCDECGQKFRHKSSLDKHKSIHTGDKPFKCDECGHKFGRKGSLSLHMRIHTGEKPFRCDECGHKFRHKSSLHKHMSIHTGDKAIK